MATNLKRIRGSDKYKYVTLYRTQEGVDRWCVHMFGNTGTYDTEREAAKQADIRLIRAGKQPVNILKRKEK